MKLKGFDINVVILLIIVVLSVIILILPLDILEFLSLEVVGEPPINGRTWLEGVAELGGELSMRMIAILGLIIVAFVVPYIVKIEKESLKTRDVSKGEIITFLTSTIFFFVINFLIGYNWWDPDAFLGMGPLFFPSIISLVILGIIPEVYRKIFKFERADFAESAKRLKSISIYMILIALGYGAISAIWHCCSFFEPKMYFFFFVIKGVQLWGMCSFFFKWGLKMMLNATKEWAAYLIISILFGFCYPWHTLGFAFTFTIFGCAICYITRKMDSYFGGLILFYFAYIFHAGLPWHGPVITFALIYPLLLAIASILAFFNLKPILNLNRNKV
jgi:hypothetical protein